MARLAFNTPGSRVDREFVADYRLDQAARTLSAHLRTPWKEAIVAGSVINTPALKNANILMTVDGKYKYSAIAEVRQLMPFFAVNYLEAKQDMCNLDTC